MAFSVHGSRWKEQDGRLESTAFSHLGQGAGWLTLTMAGSVRLSLRMYMSLRSSRVSMMKSSVRVEICIRQVNPRKLLYE